MFALAQAQLPCLHLVISDSRSAPEFPAGTGRTSPRGGLAGGGVPGHSLGQGSLPMKPEFARHNLRGSFLGAYSVPDAVPGALPRTVRSIFGELPAVTVQSIRQNK